MQSESLSDCVSTKDSTGTPHMHEERQSSSMPQPPPSPCPACLPHDSPTCPAQDPAAGLPSTIPPAQGTTLAPGILGWVCFRWATATLRQVGRSKKYCWSRSHSGECSVVTPAVPCVTHASLLWTLPYSSHNSTSTFHWPEIAPASFGASLLRACSTDLPGEGEAWWCDSSSWAPQSCMPGLGSWREADVLLWEPEQHACFERKARNVPDWCTGLWTYSVPVILKLFFFHYKAIPTC